jgi:hypothetical protein
MLLSYETSSIAYDKVDLFYGKFVPARTRKSAQHHANAVEINLLENREKQPDLSKGTMLERTDLLENTGKMPIADGNFPFVAETNSSDSSSSEKNLPIRIFCNVTGLFSDLSGRFAERYDDYVLPLVKNSDDSPSCVVDYAEIMRTVSKSAVEAIMEEKDFWRLLQPYPWYMLLFQEIYNMCGGEYYFILHFFNALQLEDRLTWCARHFGAESRKRTLVLAVDTMPLLVRSRNDILLDADLLHIEKWCDAGGSGYWWPELYGRCLEPASILAKRSRLMRQAIASLRAL